MTKHMAPPPRVLVIDDDSDLRLFLHDLLLEEGYLVDVGATLDEALALIDAHVYHLILTDLLTHSFDDPLRSAVTVCQAAYPTPVVALTGWNISAAEVERAGLARLIPKPFDLTDLLDAVASSLEEPLDAEQLRQAETLGRYCEAFSAHDLDTCVSLCAEDVRFVQSMPSRSSAPSAPSVATPAAPDRPVVGRTPMRNLLQFLLRLAPDMRFDDYLIHPQPRGLALRCVKSWRASAMSSGRIASAALMTFQFKGERITQINLRMDGQRWSSLTLDAARIPGAQSRLS